MTTRTRSTRASVARALERDVLAGCLEACRALGEPITVEIPAHPPTLNQLMRGKLRSRMRLSKTWRCVVAAYWHGPKATAKRRVRITIVLGYRQRGADPDAFFKATGDALKHCGALVDDSKEWVEWLPVRYEHGREVKTIIELEDCC